MQKPVLSTKVIDISLPLIYSLHFFYRERVQKLESDVQRIDIKLVDYTQVQWVCKAVNQQRDVWRVFWHLTWQL